MLGCRYQCGVRYTGKDYCNFFLARMSIALNNLSACQMEKRSYAHRKSNPLMFAYHGFEDFGG
jgi:hypothetical protein